MSSRFRFCASAIVAGSFVVVGASMLAACSQAPAPAAAPADTRAADEAAIRAAVTEWSAAARDKDADKFASFYADDAVLMLEGAPDSSGKPAIREAIGGLMSDANFALSFETTGVVVARSGDLAYETGHYALTTTGANQQPGTQRGNYVVVWRKQSGGDWKAVIDAPISDPPATQ